MKQGERDPGCHQVFEFVISLRKEWRCRF